MIWFMEIGEYIILKMGIIKYGLYEFKLWFENEEFVNSKVFIDNILLIIYFYFLLFLNFISIIFLCMILLYFIGFF